MFDRVISGDETQYDPETKQAPEHAVENTEFTPAEKSTQVSLAVQDHAFAFLRSQGDSSI
jgi:hypothetical protein